MSSDEKQLTPITPEDEEAYDDWLHAIHWIGEDEDASDEGSPNE